MGVCTVRIEDICFLKSAHAILDGKDFTSGQVEDRSFCPNAELVKKIHSGRKDIIDSLVREYSDRLYLIILRMVQSPDTAEDLLQDTWILVIRKLHQYDPARPIGPWLTQIAVNCCRSYWRRERIKRLFSAEEIRKKTKENENRDRDCRPADLEARQIAEAALNVLSPKLREVVILKFYSGMPGEEIAEILDIPPGTVKSRLNRAMLLLRDYLKQGKIS
jgi:RNA polymerase sigma-70 factor (ECF subfamily)